MQAGLFLFAKRTSAYAELLRLGGGIDDVTNNDGNREGTVARQLDADACRS